MADPDAIGSQQIRQRSPSPVRRGGRSDDSDSDDPDTNSKHDSSSEEEAARETGDLRGTWAGRQDAVTDLEAHSTKQGHSCKQDRKASSGTCVVMRCASVLDKQGHLKTAAADAVTCDYFAYIGKSLTLGR